MDADLWRCSICRATHPGPVARCRRCDANLLILARIKTEAARLRELGREAEAEALACDHRKLNPASQ